MNYTLETHFNKKNCPDWKAFWQHLSNFLDEFNAQPNTQILSTPPPDIDEKINCFLAATVEQLAITHGFNIPRWVYDKKYFLKEPFFPSGLKGDYRFFALRESPLAFRARQVFVTKNVLERC